MGKTNEEVFSILTKPALIYQIKIDLIRMTFDTIEEEISRVIEVNDKQTLYDLHLAVQNLFGWDNDHMFSFYLGEELFDRANEYSGNPLGEHNNPSFGQSTKSAADTELRDLDLSVDFSFWYLFDYGDELVHKVTVEKIREMVPGENGFPNLIDKTGTPPSQYEDFDDE